MVDKVVGFSDGTWCAFDGRHYDTFEPNTSVITIRDGIFGRANVTCFTGRTPFDALYRMQNLGVYIALKLRYTYLVQPPKGYTMNEQDIKFVLGLLFKEWEYLDDEDKTRVKRAADSMVEGTTVNLTSVVEGWKSVALDWDNVAT